MKNEISQDIAIKDAAIKDAVLKEEIIKNSNQCPKCGFYTDGRQPACSRKHGGGKSGGGSEDSLSQEDNDVITQHNAALDESAVIAIDVILANLDKPSSVNEPDFDREVIAKLLTDGLLSITLDKDSKTLTIFADLNQLSSQQITELEKFIRVILNTLNAFKKEKDISSECLTIDPESKLKNILSLTIKLPTLALYLEFTERLANKNVLSFPGIKNHDAKVMTPPQQDTVSLEHFSHFPPSPYSTKFVPSSNKRKRDEDEEVREVKKAKL